MINNDHCPRCSEGQLKSWAELSDDEREVVKRLPDSADFSEDERRATRRWCPRCWFEATDNTTSA